jgi:uncharacterized membrane protein YdjX (TVP38/TMEM64 family)
MLLGVIVMFCIFWFYPPFSFSSIQLIAVDALAYVEEYPLRGMVLFALFYGVICALPTPFVSVFTMMAGYLFGNLEGFLIVSFMSAIGGSVMFLMVRYALRDWVYRTFEDRLHRLHKVSDTESFMMAVSLRLIPGMPFPVPAAILALSPLSLWKFYVSTQLGLTVTLFVYVNAGRSLAQIQSLQDVLSPQLIGSMLLLAVVPLVLAFIIQRYKRHFG